MLLISCKNQKQTSSFDDYPTPINENLWTNYSKESTLFRLWSPNAEEIVLRLFKTGNNSEAFTTKQLKKDVNGIWQLKVEGDLNGTYYTYQVKINNRWLSETPGIYAYAVGVNGDRAMVLDLKSTNPKNWEYDKGPDLKHPNEALLYELHIRDMTIHLKSGSSLPDTYLGLIEQDTKGPENISTGIDHLKELGITHVHLLPTFDHYSIDETNLGTPQFNWGYDPKNYNVPEGSFSSNPYNAAVRIKEFKQMVKTFHDNGIGVIMDVVYNHTGKTEESNFNQEVPGYYYRHWQNGTYADAAACGNETASERAMMQKFIIESVKHWTNEYHIDGFRFDLMGIHDIETMNKIADTVKKINPDALLYGEGWTAKESPLPEEKRALKKHMQQIPQIAAFNDDIRDGIKGSVFEDESTGFVSGAKDMEESIKFGIVGAIQHPQLNYEKVNYLHAGVEMLRTKNGEHNSYNLPDSINQINWNWKVQNKEVFQYYKNLISLRKAHPAFYMQSAKDVVSHLKFQTIEDGIVSYIIKDNANEDSWKNILVIYNANNKTINHKIKGTWQEAVSGDTFDLKGERTLQNSIEIPALSTYIAFQK